MGGRPSPGRFSGPPSEHLPHALDLDDLIGLHVGGEAENLSLLAAAFRCEEVVHHLHGPLMMVDHEFQEEAVELLARRGRKRFHLGRRQHPRHPCVVVAHGGGGVVVMVVIVMPVVVMIAMVVVPVVGVGVPVQEAPGGQIHLRHRLAPILEPTLHEFNLIGLGSLYPPGERLDIDPDAALGN